VGRLAALGGPPETCNWVAANAAAAAAAAAQHNKTTPDAPIPAGRAGTAPIPAGESRAVLKLQHEGVDRLMVRDMVSALRIARLMRWLDPK
jgi:hypothetical protein